MKLLLRIFYISLTLYLLLCGALYSYQENLIFFPKKLDKEYQFRFNQNFEELNIESENNFILNGLLFKAKNSKGLIFYLHGNAGALDSWGEVAKTYTDLNYDLFILDYRGYGKSEGKIENQEQLFQDNQNAYNELKKRYSENNIIIIGYSIGTGLASKLASQNAPKLLILQAPYYSLVDMMEQSYPIIPTSILKYKFTTNEYLAECPYTIIFHGNEDKVIYYGSSAKLKEAYPDKITLITLENQGHNGITYNEKYQENIKRILN